METAEVTLIVSYVSLFRESNELKSKAPAKMTLLICFSEVRCEKSSGISAFNICRNEPIDEDNSILMESQHVPPETRELKLPVEETIFKSDKKEILVCSTWNNATWNIQRQSISGRQNPRIYC